MKIVYIPHRIWNKVHDYVHDNDLYDMSAPDGVVDATEKYLEDVYELEYTPSNAFFVVGEYAYECYNDGKYMEFLLKYG